MTVSGIDPTSAAQASYGLPNPQEADPAEAAKKVAGHKGGHHHHHHHAQAVASTTDSSTAQPTPNPLDPGTTLNEYA